MPRLKAADRANAVQPAYATIPEAAAYLTLSRATIYTLMDRGEIPYAKFGDCRRIPWAGLRAYAERCTVKAG